MPGTSVQISQRSAPSFAASVVAEVSDPPRPSSTVSPSGLWAMKPWVISTASGRARSRAIRASSRSNGTRAER